MRREKFFSLLEEMKEGGTIIESPDHPLARYSNKCFPIQHTKSIQDFDALCILIDIYPEFGPDMPEIFAYVENFKQLALDHFTEADADLALAARKYFFLHSKKQTQQLGEIGCAITASINQIETTAAHVSDWLFTILTRIDVFGPVLAGIAREKLMSIATYKKPEVLALQS